jgi:hypothetical protein
MGFLSRVLAPKPAKTVKRAVTRPAKTARQLVTPARVKRTASRAWRAADPGTGIRQEIEGRAVSTARSKLHGANRVTSATLDGDAPLSAAVVAAMRAAGWTYDAGLKPQRGEVGSELRDFDQFAIVEAERRASLEALRGYPGGPRELEELMIANLLCGLQNRLIGRTLNDLWNRQSIDDIARIVSWAEDWLGAVKIDNEQRPQQEKALVARMDSDVVEAVRERAQQHVNDILRWPPGTRPMWGGIHGGTVETTFVGAHMVKQDGTRGQVVEVENRTTALVTWEDGTTARVHPAP